MGKSFWRITEEMGEENPTGEIQWKTIMTKTIPMKPEQAKVLADIAKMKMQPPELPVKESNLISRIISERLGTPSIQIPKNG